MTTNGQATLRKIFEASNDGDWQRARSYLANDVVQHRATHGLGSTVVQSTGADLVACAFLIELSFLEGRSKLEPCEVFSLITY